MLSEQVNRRLRSLRSPRAFLGYILAFWGPIDSILGKVGDFDTAHEHWPQVHSMLTTIWAYLQTGYGYLTTLIVGIGWLAYLVIRGGKPDPVTVGPGEKEAQFLTALTKLSRTSGVGMGTQHELFVMEIGGERDDFNRTYKIDPQVGLLFD